MACCVYPLSPPHQVDATLLKRRSEIKPLAYADVHYLLAKLAHCCGRCFVVVGEMRQCADVNECPAAQAMAAHYQTHVGRGAGEAIMPCARDMGYHKGGDCPLQLEDGEKLIRKAIKQAGLCSHCWLADDQFAKFCVHPATTGGSSTFGGSRCRAAHGRDSIRDAVYAMYHARPEFVADVMGGVIPWINLSKTTNHHCASYPNIESNPIEMPSLEDFAWWASSRWQQSLAMSNGVVLLLYYVRMARCGFAAEIALEDYQFWQALCRMGTLDY